MAASTKTTVTINAAKTRETKNTVVYQNTAPGRERDAFYLLKTQAAELGNPESITITFAAS